MSNYLNNFNNWSSSINSDALLDLEEVKQKTQNQIADNVPNRFTAFSGTVSGSNPVNPTDFVNKQYLENEGFVKLDGTTTMTGDLKTTDVETSAYFSVNDQLAKIDNITSATQAPDITNFSGKITATDLSISNIYDKASETTYLNFDGIDINVSATNLNLNGLPTATEDYVSDNFISKTDITVVSDIYKPLLKNTADQSGSHYRVFLDTTTKTIYAANNSGIATYTYDEDYNITPVSTLGLTGSNYSCITVSDDRNAAYLTNGSGRFTTVNVSNIASMSQISSATTYTYWEPLVVGNILYIATAAAGIVRYDITNTAIAPVFIAAVSTTASPRGLGYLNDRLYIGEVNAIELYNTSTHTLVAGSYVSGLSGDLRSVAPCDDGIHFYAGSTAGDIYIYDYTVESAPVLSDTANLGHKINDLTFIRQLPDIALQIATDDGLYTIDVVPNKLNITHINATDDSCLGVYVDTVNKVLITGQNGDGVSIWNYDNILGLNRAHITSIVNAHNKDTGALVIEGGVGIKKDTYINGKLNIANYLQFDDIAAPSNPSNAQGRLYKKTGNAGIFWKPDSTGPEVDLTDTGISDHGALTGLADDDHTQYTLLAGRATGQTIKGGTGAGENLTLESTSNATKGLISALNPLRLPNYATGSIPAAAAGNAGAIVYDTTDNTPKYSNGSSWLLLNPINVFNPAQISYTSPGNTGSGNIATVTGSEYTVATTGTYEVYCNGIFQTNNTTVGVLGLYVNGYATQNYGMYTSIATNTSWREAFTFVFRGAVSAGQTINVRGYTFSTAPTYTFTVYQMKIIINRVA